MGLIAVTLLVGIVLVVVNRGSIRRLAELRFRGGWLLIAGLGLQVALTLLPFLDARWRSAGFTTLAISYALLLAFCALNLRHRTMALIALGVALNATCILLNHGMPYRPARGSALRASVKNRPEQPGDRVMVLGDVIITPRPIPAYNSIGDFVICSGVLLTMIAGSQPAQRKPRISREVSAQSSATPPSDLGGGVYA